MIEKVEMWDVLVTKVGFYQSLRTHDYCETTISVKGLLDKAAMRGGSISRGLIIENLGPIDDDNGNILLTLRELRPEYFI